MQINSLKDLDSYLGNKNIPVNKNEYSEENENKQRFKDVIGAERTPIDTLQDMAVGAMRSGQNIAALLGEGGQAIGSLAEPLRKYIPERMKFVPDVNIRKEMGLERDEQGKQEIDFQNIIGSKNPNQIIQAMSQYAPGVAFGGGTTAGQMVSNALYSGTQASPDEKNLFGRLPEGRTGAMIEGGLGAFLPKAISKSLEYAGKGISHLRPNKSAMEYMKKLTGRTVDEPIKGKTSFQNEPTTKSKTSLPTDIENIEELGKRTKFGRESAEQEALIPKNKLFSTEENKNILPHNSNGKYLNLQDVDKNYKSFGLDELHDSYKKNPTLKNSDKLKSEIGREKRKLQEKIDFGNWNYSDRIKLKRLQRNENALLEDQEKFFKTLSPDKQNLYKDFRTKWAKNVPKYTESSRGEELKKSSEKVIRQLSEGNISRLGKSNIASAFEGYPSEDIEGILKDIGSSGENNIKYNKLLSSKPGNAKSLAESIISARRTGGYSRFITKKDEDFARELLRRLKYRKIAKTTVSALGTVAAAGIGFKKFSR